MHCWQFGGGLFGPVLVCAVAGHWSAVRISRRAHGGGVQFGVWVDPSDTERFRRAIIDRLVFAYPEESSCAGCPACEAEDGSLPGWGPGACPACGALVGCDRDAEIADD